MYQIILINGSIETTIHYPSPDNNIPKVISPHINKARGQAQQLNFSIYPNNPGFNLLVRMATRVKVIDLRDNTEIFAGRVYTAKFAFGDKAIYKEVVCEGELNYLQDTVQDSVIYEDKTAQEMLQIFLDYHNSQIEDYKKIQLGNVTVTDWIFCTTNNETTLECITKYVYNEDLGYLQLRKENGINYLDYLAITNDKIIDVTLGQNLLSLIQTDDQTFGTRIVPIGANGLTINNVNDGKKYLEDADAVAKYGFIYKTVEFSDVDDDTELKSQCEAQLSSYTSPKQSLELDVVDLASLANVSTDMIDETTSVHITNFLMGIDETWKVVEYDTDLNEVYKPKVTLSNKAPSLTNSLSSIVGSMVRNEGIYDGVQIGDSFGLRIKKGDVMLLLNAKDGISITNGDVKVFYIDSKGHLNIVNGYISLTNGTNTIKIDPDVGIKITKANGVYAFYVDTDGEVIHDGKQEVTSGGKTLIENWKNNNGGLTEIFDNDGNLNVKAGSENGTSENNGGTFILYNDGEDKPRLKLGIAKDGDFGVLEILNKDGQVKAEINGDDTEGNGVVFIVNSNGVKQRLATELYVQQYVADHMPSTPTS